MDRRKVLMSAAAAALTLSIPTAVPTPAVARDAQKIAQIDKAFAMTERYGFTLEEKAALFGIYPQGISALAELREIVLEWALDYGSVDIMDRAKRLSFFGEKLNEKFGRTNLKAQLAWLDHQCNTYPSPEKSYRERMVVGSMFDLHVGTASLGDMF